MGERIVLLVWLFALPLFAQEDSRRPSPFPEKNRETRSAAAAKKRYESRRDRSTRPVRPAEGRADREAAPKENTTSEAMGKACFFSTSVDGARTAGGERLNAEELVGAHSTFLLGSRVKVTNLLNGKSVEVRIVDRFPVSSRIISVSAAAARQLGFIREGTAEVRVELAREPATPSDRK